ncbi:hypothetical protein B0F90DRAFT_1665249 [Multifurca ochricompacta]|uniref:DRBM domain-containing protein n=1 Tax=Multifurca ochricompacta TaxID=376703 RepID=A0AAD4MAM0_9AGAM|nr:hypothetical protein B0F90DRAFT_1665249 [Multifurca ochricompacta]
MEGPRQGPSHEVLEGFSCENFGCKMIVGLCGKGPPNHLNGGWGSLMADPVRDLNNFLQGQPGGSLTKDFMWVSKKEGPEHGAIYHVTAIFRGVHVGVGHGSSIGSAKRDASVQALEYLRSHGNGTN